MPNMDEALAKFEVRKAEYCPLLDPALLYSILSDYDLSVDGDRANATNALDQLREFALLEESADFDPSGTAYQHDGSEGGTRTASRLEGSATSSRETDISSVMNDLGEVDLSDTLTPDVDSVDLDTVDEETKIMLLLEVFQDKTTPYNVRYTLQKCNGRWDAAMEDLFSQVGISDMLQEEESGAKLSNKGVDAFAEENGFRRGRKGKGKRTGQKALHKLQAVSNSNSPTDALLPIENRWQTTGRDTEFLASRTGLPLASIQSLYNSLGASLPATIMAILKSRSKKISREDREDPVMVANAYDLEQDYPGIEPENIFALIHVTHPSISSARELAKELTACPRTPAGGIRIIPQYSRPVLDDVESTWQKPQTQKISRPSTPAEYDISSASDRSKTDTARAIAFQKARAAYRKSKSNPLMGGAAAYYSQEARDLGALSSQATAQAADHLAARQSTSSEVDLHGIDVLNAVRIAEERVGQWWMSLGENRVNGRVGAGSRRAGYRIVVGLGTHSAGGKGVLGPAVSKALKSRGWKMENLGAVILVRGR